MKYLAKLLIIIYIITVCVFNPPTSTVYGRDFDDEITKANNFIEKTFGYVEYYKPTSDYGYIIQKYVTEGHGAFHRYPLMIYGTAQEATKSYFKIKGTSSPMGEYSERNEEYRSLGFTREGCPFPNPWFPPDFCRHGTNDDDHEVVPKESVEMRTEFDDSSRYWIKDPYDMAGGGQDKRKLSKKMPGLGGTGDEIWVNDATADMINGWVRTDSFRPDRVRNIVGNKKYFANLVVNPPKSIKNNLEDYLAVLSPPTEYSWGIGIAFYYLGPASKIQSRYALFYLKPLDMLSNDLSANFEYVTPGTIDPYGQVPRTVEPNEEVTIGIKVGSKERKPISGIDYKLEIKKDDGTPITESEDNLKFIGNIDINKNTMDITQNGNIFYIEFTMPEDSNVIINFSINKDGKDPEEFVLDNNTIETKLKLKKPPVIIDNIETDYVLEYDEYTKEFQHSYKEGQAISASLSEPSGFVSWLGSTLIDFSKTDDGIREVVDGEVKLTNVPTSSSSTDVSIYPKIEWKTKRGFFNDDPPGKVYHPNGTSLLSFGQKYGGEISRGYEYRVYHSGSHSSSCPKDCSSSHSYYTYHTSTTSADFPGGYEKINIKAKVYNGSEIGLKQIAKGEENTGDKLNKKIFWEGNRYEIPVQRFMRNVKMDGSTESLVRGDGKYKRVFQHTDRAEVTYSIVKSMAEHFKGDRDNARAGKTKSFQYAPFATDKHLQNLPFPLKSGYNYIPYAQYKAKVRTEIYKWEGEKTEHQAIVNSLKNSFKVTVELPTLNAQNQKVTTLPIGITPKYKKISDTYLTYKSGPTGVNEYLNGSENSLLGNTDSLFKEILEGWSFSNTQNSWTNYKYREYVKEAKVRKVVEETEIVFTVNPNMHKFLTPITINGKNVQDDDYFIRVWFDGFSNTHQNSVKSSKINAAPWSSTYTNDRWNMVFNIRGTRHEDQGSDGSNINGLDR
ncbi:MAG: Athe_2463 domain-containing protein [Bacillota bacterium]